MLTPEENRLIYKSAYQYLISILPESINEGSLNKYFECESRNFKSLEEVFERFIVSAQNYQAMPNIINFETRKKRIKKILFDYNLRKIASLKIENLYQTFRKEFKVTSVDSKMNSWYKWSKSVIDTAKFICGFKDIEDFKTFVRLFDYNPTTRIALPLLISTKISGIGFALACDALKELGFIDYPKPDVHLINVFSSIDTDCTDSVSVFETITRMAIDCQNEDSTVTPYKIDKVFWLICSGNYYLDKLKITRHRDDFISYLQQKLNIQSKASCKNLI